ncbi:CoA transferase [Pararoseomonas indoligenes]|uniref:CoA transferase n=1 Tax=Roseomonas indoligenes TaxID=2820811 RepID=UPI003158E7EF
MGADVFVSNVRPQALARLGLAAEALLPRNPRLIHAALGFGQGGPYAAAPGPGSTLPPGQSGEGVRAHPKARRCPTGRTGRVFKRSASGVGLLRLSPMVTSTEKTVRTSSGRTWSAPA